MNIDALAKDLIPKLIENLDLDELADKLRPKLADDIDDKMKVRLDLAISNFDFKSEKMEKTKCELDDAVTGFNIKTAEMGKTKRQLNDAILAFNNKNKEMDEIFKSLVTRKELRDEIEGCVEKKLDDVGPPLLLRSGDLPFDDINRNNKLVFIKRTGFYQLIIFDFNPSQLLKNRVSATIIARQKHSYHIVEFPFLPNKDVLSGLPIDDINSSRNKLWDTTCVIDGRILVGGSRDYIYDLEDAIESAKGGIFLSKENDFEYLRLYQE